MSAEKSAGDGKNAPEASDGIDPDEIGVAGGAVDGAAGQDDVVAGLELQSGLRGLARVIEQHVSRVKGLAKHGQHAPRQRQLIPDGLVGGHADDIGRDAEARDHAHGSSGKRADDNGFRADVDGHAAGGVRDGVEQILDLEVVAAEARLIVDVLFRLLADLGHGLHGLDGVFSGGGLAGEHDRARAVIDGVGHVGDLRAGGARILDHGFEHFRGGDDALSEQAALGDEIFLDGRKLRKRYFDAEVAAADHDALAFLADLFDVVDAGTVFDFGDDVDPAAAVFLQKALEVCHVLTAGDKGGGDVVHAVLNAEEQITLVLLAQIDLLEHLAGEAHALAVGEPSSGDDTAVDLGALDGQHLEYDKPVVDEHGVAGGQLAGQAGVADGDDGLVALYVLSGREGEFRAVGKLDISVLKGADAVFGAFGVEHDGDRQAEPLPNLLDHVKLLLVLLVRAVREVQPRDVQARAAHVGKYGGVAADRADGTYDLCFSHSVFSCVR